MVLGFSQLDEEGYKFEIRISVETHDQGTEYSNYQYCGTADEM